MAWIQLARVELIVAMATGHLEAFWQQLPGTDKIIGRDGRVDWGETHTNKVLRVQFLQNLMV